ncbi:hypothetical protein [Scytonema sp. HK-05]|uniref:hypothetical protein n=1 Tax=Scytonema sp. HK-05 TaxID=1137095 RepID=UPI001E5E8D4C|nr:hypothetical protein [Scytonema sp. HK-05]
MDILLRLLRTDLNYSGLGGEAIALTQHLQPDVILIDVRMPICNGVAVNDYNHYF